MTEREAMNTGKSGELKKNYKEGAIIKRNKRIKGNVKEGVKNEGNVGKVKI